MTPELHTVFLYCATVAALLFSAVVLARNPKPIAARMHAVYGLMVSFWFFTMAMVASAEATDEVQLWGRLLHLSIGMLPGVVFHLNAASIALVHEYRNEIRIHYILSAMVTAFCLVWPDLLASPRGYPWGPYLSYTAWGLIPASFLFVTLLEILALFRRALRRRALGSAYAMRARALFYGNVLAMFALVDFLPAFGFAVYPFAFVLITIMNGATTFGAIRYRLVELNPEIAAERILDTIPDGVLVVDPEGLVRLANTAAARILGRSSDDFLDHTLASVIPDEGLLHALRAIEASDVGGTLVREVSFQGPDGRHRFLGISGIRVADKLGFPAGCVWILHDLTEQRAAESEKDRLEGFVRRSQKLETLGVIAGGVAHDFNNILTTIQGNADLARMNAKVGASVDGELRIISKAVAHAAGLTDQLLTYAGRGPSVKEPLDLNAATREMVELMNAGISKKATLKLELAADLPNVVGDESQLRQVILNLITNASEALGDSPGTITLQTGILDEDYVFVRVTDTGLGMDAATKEKMFDPFFTTKFVGRGLGLATVMGIVQGHAGLIRVDSEPERGCSFTVALPATAEPIQTRVEETNDEWKGSGVALVIDDERAVRGVTHRMLTGAGFDVIEACDGRRGVHAFSERKSDIAVVVLDMTMPEMSGTETFQEIRSIAPEIPIVFVSGYAEFASADCIGARQTSMLRKPFNAVSLVSKVREAMTREAR